MTDLLERVVLPVADPEDAAASADALGEHEFGSVLVVNVIEKAGGAADKASVDQREEYAEEMFAAARERLGDAGTVETEIAFGTDVTETIFSVADDYGATAIVITPRGGSRWVRLLTGDVALSLVTETDRPVVVLPDLGELDEVSGGDAETVNEAGLEDDDSE
jgi:nucleotide-binding universal stress UspA family protein